jgi:hypothetical protein
VSQIKIQCPNPECGKVLAVDGSLAGKKGKCSTCGTVFQIPAAVASKSAAEKAARSQPKTPAAARPTSGTQKPAAAQRKTAPGAAKPSAGKAPARGGSPRKPAGQRPAPDDAILDAELLDDDDLVEESPRRRAAASAGKRRRPVEDEYQDYEDYEDYSDDFEGLDDFEDYDDDRPVRRSAGRSRGKRKSSRGPSTTQKWRRVSTGMMISAIGCCVLAGAFAFLLLSELLLNVAILNIASAAESRDLDSVQSARSMIETSATVYKIGRVGMSVALAAAIAGFAFYPFAPAQKGSLGLGIATLVAGSAWFLVDLVFRTLRAFDESTLLSTRGAAVAYETFLVAISGGEAYREGGDKVLCLLFEAIGIAALVLLALFLAAAARAQKDRGHASDCMRPVWCMVGYGSVILLLYIIAFIDWEREGGGIPWYAYVSWFMHWAANVLYAVVLVFLIKALFYSRRTTG